MLINPARPKMAYAKSGEFHIAYMTLQSEGPPLVFVPGLISHLELIWEEPSIAWFLRRLAGFSRLIVFDKRGTGLSDPVTALPSTDERMDDIRAVLDAVGVGKAILFGASEGGSLCTLFAAHHPERTLGLALFGAFARLRWAADYPFGWDDARIDALTREELFEDANPSVSGDDRALIWAKRYRRCATSPRMFADLMRMNVEVDIRANLPNVSVPALVMAREDDRLIDQAHGRFIAEHIPAASFDLLSGADHAVWYGDSEAVLSHLEAFTARIAPAQRVRSAIALTPREKDVIHHLYADYTAAEISKRLQISSRTVESHIASIYGKFGVNSRAELQRFNLLAD